MAKHPSGDSTRSFGVISGWGNCPGSPPLLTFNFLFGGDMWEEDTLFSIHLDGDSLSQIPKSFGPFLLSDNPSFYQNINFLNDSIVGGITFSKMGDCGGGGTGFDENRLIHGVATIYDTLSSISGDDSLVGIVIPHETITDVELVLNEVSQYQDLQYYNGQGYSYYIKYSIKLVTENFNTTYSWAPSAETTPTITVYPPSTTTYTVNVTSGSTRNI